MDLPDSGQERGIGFCSLTDRAITQSVIASRRDLKHGTNQPHRIGVAVVLNEAEAYVRVPAKIAIDFLRNSRIEGAWHCLQDEAQRFGPALKVGEDAAAMLLLIVIRAGVSIVHAVPEGVVE